MDHKVLPVKGYKPQPEDLIDLVNEGKELEERVLRYLDKVATLSIDDKPINADPRWVAVAKTHIQQGFMASTRAIFNPERIKLPEDG